jgi:DnaK suppressor protein
MDVQTQSHLPALRQWLLHRQNELQAEVRAANESRRGEERGAEVWDSKDLADMQQCLAGDDLQLARDLAELQDVEDALGRLDSGLYGDCGHCGLPIAMARLEVQPAARLCARCQGLLETRR